MKKRIGAVLCLLGLLVASPAIAADVGASTPAALVQTYDSLADAILAVKQSEWNLVHSILATTYEHAEAVLASAEAKLKAGEPAGEEIRTLAQLVSQLGYEGDASVAAIRKRLLEGGHHHNSSGEEKGIYDEGFVIVTRDAKKVFLDSAKAIGRMGDSATAAGLRTEWSKVEKTFRAVCESAEP